MATWRHDGLSRASRLAGALVIAWAGSAAALEPVGRALGTAPPDAAATDTLSPEDLPPGVAQPSDTILPTIQYDPEALPPPVRRLREQIIEAASTGDPDKLRPIIAANGVPPMFSFGDVDDPIAFLKSSSGDPEGREILAILIEVFEAGYVHVDVGTQDEMYIWPYFARYPVDALTPEQMVELFKLVYAGDYEDMKVFGRYLWYRAGIAPDGTWRYFLAGD